MNLLNFIFLISVHYIQINSYKINITQNDEIYKILIIKKRLQMKVLVGIKRVIDYTSQKIKIKDNNVDFTNTRMYINPFCEIAMQEASNLKAKNSIK